MPIEGKTNEIRDSEAYKDPSHEGHQDAKDALENLFRDHYGTESAESESRTLLDKKMEEALDELHGKKKKPNPEARLTDPVVEGGAKFGDPMKVDESGNPVGILERPDLYKIDPDSLLTKDDLVDGIESNEDFDEFMKEVQPKWSEGDQELLDAFLSFGDTEGIPAEHTNLIFSNFVQSPEFGKTFTVKDGEEALVQLCGGDVKMASNIRDRAVDVVSRMPEDVSRMVIEDTSLGNNPRLIYLLSSLVKAEFGSDVDDLSV